MKDFDRDAGSQAVSILAQVDAPGDNESEAAGDMPPASAEDRSARDRGGQDSVGSTTDNGSSRALSTQADGPAGLEAPRASVPTLHLKRPAPSGVVRQSYSHGRSKAVVVERVRRRVLAPSQGPGLPASGSGQDGGGEKVQNALSEPLATSPAHGAPIAPAPNVPTSLLGFPPCANASSRVEDVRARSLQSLTAADTPEPPKSSRKDSRASGPARSLAGSETNRAVTTIVPPSNSRGLLTERGLLNEREVASILGMASATLRNWRTQGKGPPFVRLGRAIRYDPVALREWVAQRTRRSTSDEGYNNG